MALLAATSARSFPAMPVWPGQQAVRRDGGVHRRWWFREGGNWDGRLRLVVRRRWKVGEGNCREGRNLGVMGSLEGYRCPIPLHPPRLLKRHIPRDLDLPYAALPQPGRTGAVKGRVGFPTVNAVGGGWADVLAFLLMAAGAARQFWSACLPIVAQPQTPSAPQRIWNIGFEGHLEVPYSDFFR
jgi:hypothetical protein